MGSEKITTKLTADGMKVEVWVNSDGTANVASFAGMSWTGGWISLTPADALLVAGESCLFDATEMPHLIRAAARLAKRGTILPGELRAAASLASHRAGTRPADVAPPPRKAPSKTFLEARRCRGGSLLEHVQHGCRRLFCPVCG
jgi:hypothetical protein